MSWRSRRRTFRPLVLVVATAVALQLAAAGAAQTEGYAFSIESDEVPVDGHAPVNESFDRHATLVVRCASPSSASPVPREFSLAVETDKEDVAVAVEPESVAVSLDVAACTSGDAVTHNVTVSITIPLDVRAGTRIGFDLTATAPDERTQHLEWQESVGPVMESEVWFREDRWKSGPNSRITLPLEIQTGGNADLRFHFKLAEGSSDHLNVALPGPVVVTHDPDRTTIPIDVQTPFQNGYIERVDTLSIHVFRSWVEDPDHPQEALGSVNATIETVGAFLPAPSAAFAAAALIGFLALATRRRSPP